MKKILLFCLVLVSIKLNAQSISYDQKLFYTCKVWGFVKYFHSEVSICKVNWDSVLLERLPSIKNASDINEFNNALDTLLMAAGDMEIATTAVPDTLPPELKRNRNFAWISDPVFRNDVKAILDTIKNNFRPHANCWIQQNDYTKGYMGWSVFPFDNLMFNANTDSIFPDENTRLLIFFKYWNIISYFNPYNYVLDHPWDSTFLNKVTLITNATDAITFYVAIKKIVKELNDSHAEGGTRSTTVSEPFYSYKPPIILKYIDQKYIVVKTMLDNIKIGDVITSIDGKTITEMEDSLRNFISAGNNSIFHLYMGLFLLRGNQNTTMNIGYIDSLGNNSSFYASRIVKIDSGWIFYSPNDTLANVKFKTFENNIWYVNIGKVNGDDFAFMYDYLKNSAALIFDLRFYPIGTTIIDIGNLIGSTRRMYAKVAVPDVTYPGTFYWKYHYTGTDGNTDPYKGKVIILMNQGTQSEGEHSCMNLSAIPGSIKVGSQTAGTDGDITTFKLAKDIQVTFTNLGMYYPNGDSTQRIGIVPDSVVYPTQQGIRQGRDEVLEKALQIANLFVGNKEIEIPESDIIIYPNPTNSLINIHCSTNEIKEVIIYNVMGVNVLEQNGLSQNDISLDLTNVPQGIYFARINVGDFCITKRYIKK